MPESTHANAGSLRQLPDPHFRTLNPNAGVRVKHRTARVPSNHVGVENVVAFVLSIERLKAVTRKVKPLGLDRYENSAEHSWQLALFA